MSILKNSKIYFIGFALLLILAVFFYAKEETGQSDNIIELQTVEIKEYEGKDLSSIGDFRENSIEGPQYIDKESYFLKITGFEGDDINYSYNDIVDNFQKYKKVLTLNCVEGWSATILWEGVLFRDIVEQGRIPEEANTIILRAYDGYSTSFPIEYIMDNDIILAHKMNGLELPPERGFPFQLVAESKWGYKWIKWITEIEFSDNSSYRGYWESRGYSNDGSLDKIFFE